MRKFLSIFLILFVFFNNAIGEEKDLNGNYILIDKVIAIVNGTPVLKSELEIFQVFYNIPNEKEALEKLIDNILLSQAAEKLGIKVHPDEINAFLEDLARRNGLNSVDELLAIISRDGYSISEFKNLIRRQILINKFAALYIRERILEGIEPEDVEEVATIQIIVLNKNSPNFQEKYAKIEEELCKESFENLFSKYNEDETLNETNGILKDVKKGYLMEAIDREIWKSKKGDIIEVDTGEKVYFIKIIDKKRKISEKGLTNEEINKKVEEELQKVLEKLRENSVIKYLN